MFWIEMDMNGTVCLWVCLSVGRCQRLNEQLHNLSNTMNKEILKYADTSLLVHLFETERNNNGGAETTNAAPNDIVYAANE